MKVETLYQRADVSISIQDRDKAWNDIHDQLGLVLIDQWFALPIAAIYIRK